MAGSAGRQRLAAGVGLSLESALKPKAVTKRFAISESSARRRVCSAEVLASRLAANGVSTLNAGGAVSERSQSSSSIKTRSAPCFLF